MVNSTHTAGYVATAIRLLTIGTITVSVTCNVELGSQETKLELLTVLKTRLRAYAVSLPRYTIDRSTTPPIASIELAISRYFSRHTLHSVSRDAPLIVLLLLLPTYLLFKACSIQYCTLTSLGPLILHCGFPGAVHIALWLT